MPSAIIRSTTALHELAGSDHDDVSVGGVVHNGKGDRPELEHRTHPLEVVPLDRGCTHAVEHGPGHGVLGRNVHELGLPGAAHSRMRDECRYRGFGARVAPDLRKAHSHGGSLGNTLQGDRPAQSGDREIAGCVSRVGAVAAEGGDLHVDDPRLSFA